MPQPFRDLRTSLPRVREGGYHFSWMGGVDRVITKATAVVEGNEAVVKFGKKGTDKKFVEEEIKNGTYISGIAGIPELLRFIATDFSSYTSP